MLHPFVNIFDGGAVKRSAVYLSVIPVCVCLQKILADSVFIGIPKPDGIGKIHLAVVSGIKPGYIAV